LQRNRDAGFLPFAAASARELAHALRRRGGGDDDQVAVQLADLADLAGAWTAGLHISAAAALIG
jgi:hypothetical protein